MKKRLDLLYNKYKHKYSSKDPIWSLHKLKDKKDIELAGFIISCFAYGQIDLINNFINKFFKITGKEIYNFVLNYDIKKDSKILSGLKYRFNNENDIANLVENLRFCLMQNKSLLNLFKKKYSESDINILRGLAHFSEALSKKYVKSLKGYNYLIPDVWKNSTCKRLNLFLRWMVRKDEIDLGIWGKEIDKSKLIIPVDTHVYRVSRELGLVKRKSCDMKFALELTEELKKYDSLDPVKYDFALCHIDI